MAGSPAWHGLPQCPGCGHWVSYCCAVFVFGSGLQLGVGFVNPASPGWGLGWVCWGTVCGVNPLVSAVCGVRGWGSVSACLSDVCGFVHAPLASRRFWFRRAVWACVLGPGLGCAQSFLPGLSGCVFCASVFFLLLGVPVPGLVVPVPPSPFFRAGLLALFFFFVVCVCIFRCPFFRWAAVPGLPLLGASCLLGRGQGCWCWKVLYAVSMSLGHDIAFVAHARRYAWKTRHAGHCGSERNGAWCAPHWAMTLIRVRVMYTMVMVAPMRCRVSTSPAGCRWTSVCLSTSGPC